MIRTWTIELDGEVVGVARVRCVDPGMNVWGGSFEPTPAYDSIREVFRAFLDEDGNTDPLEQYSRQRDALGLVVIDEAGARIDRIVHILEDPSEPAWEPREIVLYPCSSTPRPEGD